MKIDNCVMRIMLSQLRLVYKGYYFSVGDLLVKDNSFSIHQCNLLKLCKRKMKINVVPEFMKDACQIVDNPRPENNGRTSDIVRPK